MSELFKTGRYRHFKGNEYRLLCCARHSETLEDMVVYCSAQDANQYWVRPACMWNELVEKDGHLVPRFEYIEQA